MTPERQQFLEDVMTTAIEGGINYWAQVSKVDAPKGYVWIREREDSGEPLGRMPFSVLDIELGITRVGMSDFQVGKDIRGWILTGSAENDAGDIDVDAADVIVQAAIFEEIVYG